MHANLSKPGADIRISPHKLKEYADALHTKPDVALGLLERKVFGINVKRYLALNGRAQARLAEDLGMHQTALSKIITGNGVPSLNLARRIADNLKVELAKLFQDRDLQDSARPGSDVSQSPEERAQARRALLEARRKEREEQRARETLATNISNLKILLTALFGEGKIQLSGTDEKKLFLENVIGRNLKLLRESRGLTGKDLANRATANLKATIYGVTENNIILIETGKTVPYSFFLAAIAKVLNVEVSMFFRDPEKVTLMRDRGAVPAASSIPWQDKAAVKAEVKDPRQARLAEILNYLDTKHPRFTKRLHKELLDPILERLSSGTKPITPKAIEEAFFKYLDIS
ncbi:MAG TPA: helix-turn-helix transcriptional regulator [Candidatus Saccharimonadales bacterium]|nr:helix-turn-helix transcriptional regulator [Candidatus Saccharimonadales bacterium]